MHYILLRRVPLIFECWSNRQNLSQLRPFLDKGIKLIQAKTSDQTNKFLKIYLIKQNAHFLYASNIFHYQVSTYSIIKLLTTYSIIHISHPPVLNVDGLPVKHQIIYLNTAFISWNMGTKKVTLKILKQWYLQRFSETDSSNFSNHLLPFMFRWQRPTYTLSISWEGRKEKR